MKISNSIYLDYQATTPLNSKVFARMKPYFVDCFGNPHSVDHAVGWNAARAVEDSATKVAKLIGCDSDEIVFTSGATEANNLALLGLGRRAAGGNRRRILMSAIEHKSVLAAGRALRDQFAYEVELLPVDETGLVRKDVICEKADEDVLLISVMAANNEIGTIQDISEISSIACKHGIVFHCDAVQAPLAIDVSELAGLADLISLSSHKLYGPAGIGTLMVRRELQNCLEPLVYGGGQQNGLRSGTVALPLCVGMATAAELLCTEEAAQQRETLRAKRNRFVRMLSDLKWPVRLNGPSLEGRHPGNANVCFEGFAAFDLLAALQPKVAASTGSACSSGIPEPSHVLKAIGLSVEDAESSIRFSMGDGTSDEEIEETVGLIDGALHNLAASGLVQPA